MQVKIDDAKDKLKIAAKGAKKFTAKQEKAQAEKARFQKKQQEVIAKAKQAVTKEQKATVAAAVAATKRKQEDDAKVKAVVVVKASKKVAKASQKALDKAENEALNKNLKLKRETKTEVWGVARSRSGRADLVARWRLRVRVPSGHAANGRQNVGLRCTGVLWRWCGRRYRRQAQLTSPPFMSGGFPSKMYTGLMPSCTRRMVR